jgi:hypothetical protein
MLGLQLSYSHGHFEAARQCRQNFFIDVVDAFAVLQQFLRHGGFGYGWLGQGGLVAFASVWVSLHHL